jgi:hypothetical protein
LGDNIRLSDLIAEDSFVGVGVGNIPEGVIVGLNFDAPRRVFEFKPTTETRVLKIYPK